MTDRTKLERSLDEANAEVLRLMAQVPAALSSEVRAAQERAEKARRALWQQREGQR